MRGGATRVCAPLVLVLGLAGCGDEEMAAEARGAVGIDVEHVHGLGFVSGEPETVLVATHDGLASYSADEGVQRVSDLSSDLMGFAVGPGDVLYASGHPAEGEDGPFALGLIESRDAGRTWDPVALSGVADFHALDADESGVVGFDAANGVLRTSPDGREWEEVASEAAFLDLAADPTSERVVGTTDSGVLTSSTSGDGSFVAVAGAPPLVLVDVAPDGGLVGIDPQGRVQVESAAGDWEQRPGTVDEGLQAFAAGPDGDLWVVDGRGLSRSRDGGSGFEPVPGW